MYDPTVARIGNVQGCEQFIENVADKYPELARQARQRSLDLRVETHPTANAAERDALRVIYAYEDALRVKHGRRVRATYTWRKIDEVGILKAVEHAVKQPTEPVGYKILKELGFKDLTYERVVERHPQSFSNEVVEIAKRRLLDWERAEPESV